MTAPTDAPGPRLLTLDEAAAYLNVKRSWLREASCRGDIARVCLGRQIRFTREALDAFVAVATVPAAGGAPRPVVPVDLPQPVGRRKRMTA